MAFDYYNNINDIDDFKRAVMAKKKKWVRRAEIIVVTIAITLIVIMALLMILRILKVI